MKKRENELKIQISCYRSLTNMKSPRNLTTDFSEDLSSDDFTTLANCLRMFRWSLFPSLFLAHKFACVTFFSLSNIEILYNISMKSKKSEFPVSVTTKYGTYC